MGSGPELADEELASLLSLLEAEQSRAHLLMDVVIPIAVALAYETDLDRLLERILVDAMNLCSADGGALFLRGGDEILRPAIARTRSIGLWRGGTSGNPPLEMPIPVFQPSGAPDHRSLIARAAFWDKSVNIPDVNDMDGDECMEAKAFDRLIGYKTVSCLAVPLKSGGAVIGGRVIGVVQLLNSRRPDGEISPFEPLMQQVVESLCSLAAAALESYLRQQKLKDQVREMSIQVDEQKKNKQVSAIVETDYFKNLRERARSLRNQS
jgi:phosphoserine phosphatase RsbU/P